MLNRKRNELCTSYYNKHEATKESRGLMKYMLVYQVEELRTWSIRNP